MVFVPPGTTRLRPTCLDKEEEHVGVTDVFDSLPDDSFLDENISQCCSIIVDNATTFD